jgi:chorismate mutase
MPGETDRLAALRKELRHIDQQVIDLISKRHELVRKIGETKQTLSLPVRDVPQEEINRTENKQFAKGRLADAMVDELSDFLAHWARLEQTQAKF